jgi:hypothetical protein
VNVPGDCEPHHDGLVDLLELARGLPNVTTSVRYSRANVPLNVRCRTEQSQSAGTRRCGSVLGGVVTCQPCMTVRVAYVIARLTLPTGSSARAVGRRTSRN